MAVIIGVGPHKASHIITRNDYRHGYLNADTGRVERIDADAKMLRVRMTSGDNPGRLVTVPREYHEIDAGGGFLRYAYARTVHANQGATVEQAFCLASDRVNT